MKINEERNNSLIFYALEGVMEQFKKEVVKLTRFSALTGVTEEEGQYITGTVEENGQKFILKCVMIKQIPVK